MSVRLSDAARLALAEKREAELLEQRATMTEEEIAEVTGADIDQDVIMASGRIYTWPDFVAAYRAGDTMNAHRGIIERGGKLR